MDQEEEKDKIRVFSYSDLGPILTAGVFTVGFLAALIWVLVTDDPWHDLIPRSPPHQKETPGVVNVDLPQKH